MTQRLNKFLALHLGISRREADMLIEKGNITVNNTPAVLGKPIADTDTVAVNGTNITPSDTSHMYIALNKPVGYVCSRKRQGDVPTIYELLPREFHALKPVGRLDKNSSGLLLLTNDGDFAHRMTHPSFRKQKKYRVRLSEPLAPLHQQMIADFGVTLEDGTSKLGLERLNDVRTEWEVTMSEGRNRQIRRTFAALGYTVKRLHRTQFGPYEIDTLQSKELTSITIR